MAIHGKNGYLLFDSQNYTSYIKTGGIDTSNEVVDVTTWGKHSKAYIPGLEDGTIPLEGVWDATIDGHINTAKGDARAFEYGPAGNGPGKVKYSGNAIVSSYSLSNGINNEVTFSATLQITGDVTVGTFT